MPGLGMLTRAVKAIRIAINAFFARAQLLQAPDGSPDLTLSV